MSRQHNPVAAITRYDDDERAIVRRDPYTMRRAIVSYGTPALLGTYATAYLGHVASWAFTPTLVVTVAAYIGLLLATIVAAEDRR